VFGVYHGIGFDSGPVKFEPSPLLCLTVKDQSFSEAGHRNCTLFTKHWFFTYPRRGHLAAGLSDKER